MKLASILAIAFIAVPTLAIPVRQYEWVIFLLRFHHSIINPRNRRSYNIADSDLYDREADQIVDHLTREDLNDIFGRELVDEIDERALPSGMWVFWYPCWFEVRFDRYIVATHVK